ncbi:MAG TPA: sulfotransferase [Xanthomonadaceae bacterium]|nr:sulfotransferase [Xanthomonadaceae bacterium]
MTPHTDSHLLDAAQSARESGDPQLAWTLFVEHLAHARDDALGLARFGGFCLRAGHHATACYALYKANVLRPGDSDVLHQLGCAQYEMKDFDAARRTFEAALVRSPQHTSASYGLALCLQREGAWPAAIDAFEKALSAQPHSMPILLNLANACQQAGDIEGARRRFIDAESIAPNDPAFWLAYGKFLREHGDAAQAMRWIDRRGRQCPDDPETILEKARCLRSLGDLVKAMRWLDRLESNSPGLPETSEEYGNCLGESSDGRLRDLRWLAAINMWIGAGNFMAAEALLDRLLATNPASTAGWNERGRLQSAREHLGEAEAAWRKAIDSDANHLAAAANLVVLYEKTNRVAEAKIAAECALRSVRDSEQSNAAIELHLASSKIERRLANHQGGLEHLARIDSLKPTDSQRMYAAFERGRLLELRGESTSAIAAFTVGNALALEQWQRENPGPNTYLAGIESMLDLVRGGWLRQFKSIDGLPPTATPAFLIGFPRSGTTLLNHVLHCHSAIQTLEEKPPTQKIMAALQSMPGGNPHAIANVDALDVAYLRAAYFHSAAEHGACDVSKLIVDKFPLHINVAGLLHRVFPQAHFLFAVRHPCDVVLSCFMQQFRLNSAMANFCTLADTVALYTRTMDLWELHRTQLPLHVHTIRYEDVVDDFDGQLRALCDFLRVPWEDALMDFSTHALNRGRIDTPSYAQVSRPIYREACYRWQRYREHLAPWLPLLQPYIERFGYSQYFSSD